MGSKHALPDYVEVQVDDIRSAGKNKISFVLAVTNESTRPINLASFVGVTFGQDPYGDGLDATHVVGQKPEWSTSPVQIGKTAKQIYLVNGTSAQLKSVYVTFGGVVADGPMEVISFKGSLNP